jgi:hypothetical protein
MCSANNHYIYLPSNDSGLPGNRNNCFRIQLAHTLRFNEQMECALVEITYSKSWNNVRTHSPAFIIVNDKMKLEIPVGNYSIKDLIAAVNNLISQASRSRNRVKRQTSPPKHISEYEQEKDNLPVSEDDYDYEPEEATAPTTPSKRPLSETEEISSIVEAPLNIDDFVEEDEQDDREVLSALQPVGLDKEAIVVQAHENKVQLSVIETDGEALENEEEEITGSPLEADNAADILTHEQENKQKPLGVDISVIETDGELLENEEEIRGSPLEAENAADILTHEQENQQKPLAVDISVQTDPAPKYVKDYFEENEPLVLRPPSSFVPRLTDDGYHIDDETRRIVASLNPVAGTEKVGVQDLKTAVEPTITVTLELDPLIPEPPTHISEYSEEGEDEQEMGKGKISQTTITDEQMERVLKPLFVSIDDDDNWWPVIKQRLKQRLSENMDTEDEDDEEGEETDYETPIVSSIDNVDHWPKIPYLPRDPFKTLPTITVTVPPVISSTLPGSIDEYDDEDPRIQGLDQKLSFSLSNNRVTIHVADPSLTVELSSNLAYIMGFEDRFFTQSSTADIAPDETSGLGSLFVYTDIVQLQHIGSQLGCLLKIVDVSGGEQGECIVKSFSEPHYVPLSQNDVKEIKMELRDDQGQFFEFTYGRVIAKIHIRPCNPAS